MQTKHLSSSVLLMPLMLQGFGLFCSQSDLLCLFFGPWGWAGVWKVMRRTGTDLVSGTASELCFLSKPVPSGAARKNRLEPRVFRTCG